MDSSQSLPLAGLYKPPKLSALYYGPDVVKTHLLSCFPSPSSKAFIITGNSLATKTPLVEQVEQLLGQERHAGTFAKIGQHAPVAQLDEAAELVMKSAAVDTIISIGGGSPIDAAKAIAYRVHSKNNLSKSSSSSSASSFLTHITIPTTLSAAECTYTAGYTGPDGTKKLVSDPNLSPSYIFYDPTFVAGYTPPRLFLSTGLRALDHAVELQCYPTTTLAPARVLTLDAITTLFTYLPLYHKKQQQQQQDQQTTADHPDLHDIITRLLLASYQSLGFLGQNLHGPLGLSHTLGYALGSPYAIPHGITSCLTLGHVVKLRARFDSTAAKNFAAILPHIPGSAHLANSGNPVQDSERVGEAILGLVREVGLQTTLSEYGVGKGEVDVIVERALGGHGNGRGAADGGQMDGEFREGLKTLVEGLW